MTDELIEQANGIETILSERSTSLKELVAIHNKFIEFLGIGRKVNKFPSKEYGANRVRQLANTIVEEQGKSVMFLPVDVLAIPSHYTSVVPYSKQDEAASHYVKSNNSDTDQKQFSTRCNVGGSNGAVMVSNDGGSTWVAFSTLKKRATWFKQAKSSVQVKGRVSEVRLKRMKGFVKNTGIKVVVV
ncbi:hypothetical protein [Photobacterium lutimaris]|uniref:Uncharacterized protein n=1 Tax=Photobacterium lutimaris TaxID=388278 RepID=A0A2T3J4I4_9GAMM|nr:hypothetical protein [Photobacterium lutimaris]PSU36204.1 hypothetical protein C9I99_04175 [Photobacterium lutimaris]TDR74925.1 hypothetical protein DFP78_106256 [Photobacterium lutimaris]